MSKTLIHLANTICWHWHADDKDYISTVHVAIHQFPFATRQVFLRFANGPELDLSFFDMDRLAVEYLKLRGIKLSAQVCDLTKAVPPVQADFMLPTELASELLKRKCARCGQSCERCGEWYGELCPRCADNTEGDWVCHHCGRRGKFQLMGGNVRENPICCGSPCQQIKIQAT